MYLAYSHPSLLPFNPPPPTLPCLPSNFMDSVFFFNIPLSPISTPHISFRKIANSISISRHSFPWPLNGISLSFPGTWQGLGAVAECRARFSPDRAKWISRWTGKQQCPLSSRTALIPWTSLMFICQSSLHLSLVLHSFGVLSSPPTWLLSPTPQLPRNCSWLAFGVFSWPRMWHFLTRLLPCSEHFFPSLGCSLLITVRATHTAGGDFFSANLLAYLLHISQMYCAVHFNLIHGQDSNSLLPEAFCFLLWVGIFFRRHVFVIVVCFLLNG